MHLPFVRKEPNPRWCKVKKRCSCVRKDWRTCPTPTWPLLRLQKDFLRFQCSLPGTKAWAHPVCRCRTPPGRHLNTEGSQAVGTTSPLRYCRTAAVVQQNCAQKKTKTKILCVKEKRKPCRCKEKLFQAKSTPLQARSQNKPLLNLCFLSFLLQKSAGCDLINKCAPTDAPGPEVSRLISQIQFEVDALIGIPYLSLQAPPRLEQRGDVNLDGAHWITLSLSLVLPLSPSLPPLPVFSLLPLSPCLELLYVKCPSIRSIHGRLWLLYDNLSTRFYSCPTQGEVNPSQDGTYFG